MENQSPNGSGSSGSSRTDSTNLSSNTTLVWRIFLPVFGSVFISGLLLAFWLIDEEELYLPYSVWWPRLILVALWLAWLYFLRRRVWPLKRIDADPNYLAVTNYWTTARYPWSDIERLEKRKFLGRKALCLHLKAPGYFGKQILFLPASHFYSWMEENGKQAYLVIDPSLGH